MSKNRSRKVKNISNQISESINREVDICSGGGALQMAYEHLKFIIEYRLVEAESLVENFKEEGLTFNAIEAEGFLRCAKMFAGDLEIAKDILRSHGDEA